MSNTSSSSGLGPGISTALACKSARGTVRSLWWDAVRSASLRALQVSKVGEPRPHRSKPTQANPPPSAIRAARLALGLITVLHWNAFGEPEAGDLALGQVWPAVVRGLLPTRRRCRGHRNRRMQVPRQDGAQGGARGTGNAAGAGGCGEAYRRQAREECGGICLAPWCGSSRRPFLRRGQPPQRSISCWRRSLGCVQLPQIRRVAEKVDNCPNPFWHQSMHGASDRKEHLARTP